VASQYALAQAQNGGPITFTNVLKNYGLTPESARAQIRDNLLRQKVEQRVAPLPMVEQVRARGAVETGCDGVIASGLEAKRLKAEFKDRLLVVTPGIRPVGNKEQEKMRDDQKRTVDAAQAFAAGADYIVVGRPVHKAAEPHGLQAVIDSVLNWFRPVAHKP